MIVRTALGLSLLAVLVAGCKESTAPSVGAGTETSSGGATVPAAAPAGPAGAAPARADLVKGTTDPTGAAVPAAAPPGAAAPGVASGDSVKSFAGMPGAPAPALAPAAPTVLTQADSGKSITLAVGATLTTQLRANSGTGYTWEVTQVDRSVVSPQGPATSQPVGQAMPGGRTMETISFVAKAPGKTRVEILHRRPFEKGEPPAGTFVVDVTVK